jgi:hypothetical protein
MIYSFAMALCVFFALVFLLVFCGERGADCVVVDLDSGDCVEVPGNYVLCSGYKVVPSSCHPTTKRLKIGYPFASVDMRRCPGLTSVTFLDGCPLIIRAYNTQNLKISPAECVSNILIFI